MAKEDWKKTGKELGGAFSGLAKTLVRSAKTTVDNVEEWAEDKKDDEKPEGVNAEAKEAEEPNVFADGSWRKTGKELGSAFKSLGKSILGSAEEGAEALADKLDGDDDDK
ncbi:MAG: hypothetical protein MJ086_05625 [Lachnospiraceae bacterium]|nr:hypothetical protein [Lachnospiraceae bacterium]